MKKVLLFFLFMLAGAGLITLYVANKTAGESQVKTVSPLGNFIFSIENPPQNSLRGKIISMSGEIFWQSRTATESSKLTDPVEIKQGESLETHSDGNAVVIFPDASSIQFLPNTQIDFIQTLPDANVFSQNGGAAIYGKLGNIPLSVRTATLLTNLSSGSAKIAFSDFRPTIMVSVASGSATAAYNDPDYTTHEQIITAGESFIFNTANKSGTIE